MCAGPHLEDDGLPVSPADVRARRSILKRPRVAEKAAGTFALASEGGGFEIRTREGLPPTRFPILRGAVRRGSLRF
jgi:hypothetical protein